MNATTYFGRLGGLPSSLWYHGNWQTSHLSSCGTQIRVAVPTCASPSLMALLTIPTNNKLPRNSPLFCWGALPNWKSTMFSASTVPAQPCALPGCPSTVGRLLGKLWLCRCSGGAPVYISIGSFLTVGICWSGLVKYGDELPPCSWGWKHTLLMNAWSCDKFWQPISPHRIFSWIKRIRMSNIGRHEGKQTWEPLEGVSLPKKPSLWWFLNLQECLYCQCRARVKVDDRIPCLETSLKSHSENNLLIWNICFWFWIVARHLDSQPRKLSRMLLCFMHGKSSACQSIYIYIFSFPLLVGLFGSVNCWMIHLARYDGNIEAAILLY